MALRPSLGNISKYMALEKIAEDQYDGIIGSFRLARDVGKKFMQTPTLDPNTVQRFSELSSTITPEEINSLKAYINDAKQVTETVKPFLPILKKVTEFGNGMSDFWNGLGPNGQRGVLTGLISGSVPLIFGDGPLGDRLISSLGYGTLGALGGYGLSRTGLWDAAKDGLTTGYDKAMKYLTSSSTPGNPGNETTTVPVTGSTQATATK